MSVQRQIATAKRILNKSGETVVLTSPNAGMQQYDPATGDPLPIVAGQTITVKGYLGRYESKDADGVTVLATDGRLILPATTPRIDKGWTATMDNTTLRVMSVSPIRNQGTDVILVCQVRL
jgi:hypothetical protein